MIELIFPTHWGIVNSHHIKTDTERSTKKRVRCPPPRVESAASLSSPSQIPLNISIHKTGRRRVPPRNSRTWKITFLLSAIFSIASGGITIIGPVVDESDCYSDLIDADVNKDRLVDKEEFVIFVQLQTGQFYNVKTYDDLPDAAKQFFEDTAICINGEETCDVDDKRIPNYGAGKNEIPTQEQFEYLFKVCERSVVIIDEVLTPLPTPYPTPIPVPTSSPTLAPLSTQIPSEPLTDISGVLPPQPPSNNESVDPTGLGLSAVIGIAAAAFVAGFAAIAGLYSHRSHRRRKDEVELYEPKKDRTLGAAPASYGPKSNKKIVPKGFSSLDDDWGSDDMSRSLGGGSSVRSIDVESYASSSQAGSSGWSSSAGVSSLNTGSVDSEGDNKMYGSSLAQIGVASGVTGRMSQEYNPNSIQFLPMQRNKDKVSDFDNLSDTSDLLISSSFEQPPHPIPTVSRADLDSAIEAGDWAAVGATAALLATASDSLSSSTNPSRSTSRSSRSALSEIDTQRAAELDHLVDTGDWEGVVLAAARYERGGEDEGSKSLESSDGRSGSGGPLTSLGSTGTGTSTYTGSKSGIISSPSTEKDTDEIRSEVEALVRRVCPDEIENVDEMMVQFKGREEELLETLRTMQERSIAQRARQAMHKNAKREARRSARDGRKQSGIHNRMAGDGSVGARSFGEMQWRDESKPPLPMKSQSLAASDEGRPPHIAMGAAMAVGAAAATAATRTVPSIDSDEFSEPRFEGLQGPQDSQSSDHNDSETNSASFRKAVAPLNKPPRGPSSTTTGNSSRKSDDKSNGDSNDQLRRRQLRQRSRTALEMAIEAGDWEAVGEAAAMMSDNSVTTASTDELRGVTEGEWDSQGYESSTGSFKSCTSINADRAAELDEMIDKGDWSGVVAAASRFSSIDKLQKEPFAEKNKEGMNEKGELNKTKKTDDKGSLDSSGGSVEVRNKDDSLQEEQDALAQAEIWMAIAAQSKQDSTIEAKGASDAADWAISRSLVALNAGGPIPGKTTHRESEIGERHKSASSSLGSSKGDKSV